MSGSDNNKHSGLLFQVKGAFGLDSGRYPYRCLISREEDIRPGMKPSILYRVVLINEGKLGADELLEQMFRSSGSFEPGGFPKLPFSLPTLHCLQLERETGVDADRNTTRIHIGLSSGGAGKEPLGDFDLCLRNKQTAFLIRIAPSIRFDGIPLADKVFQAQDGISDITVGWSDFAGENSSRFGIRFTVTIGEWRQVFAFGCLSQPSGAETQAEPPATEPAPEPPADREVEKTFTALLEKPSKMDEKPGNDEVQVDQKKGPFAIKQIGVEFVKPKSEGEELKVFVKFSVFLSFSILDVQMTGLKLGLPIKNLTDFSLSDLKNLEFDMEGLAVDFENHGLVISGAMRKSGSAYSGALRVKYKTFELSAIGAYERLPDGNHSLFFWLLVRASIGGPPAFFITGLAAGFGFNRRIMIPDIKEVKNFPLVAMVREKNTAVAPPGIGEVLCLLDDYVKPEKGSYFIALGVEFTTFEILRTFALGIVTFGTELELYLLGITTLSLPQGAAHPLIYAELAMKVSILPSKGVISLEGSLTSESYLFDKNCRLTGGFAMYIWFGDNQYAGDFVVTIGGYHPQYQVPSHYPKVDRVGIRWAILPQLTLEGEAYFALTPSGIMAGGGLSILYQSGGLSAWFIANADFLMQWAPLHYDIAVQVRVGVSYTFKIFGFRKTLKVELGASLHLYGPEFAGEVSISWFVISFTIRFGRRNPVTPKLSWMEFKTKFLSESQKFRVVSGMNEQDGESDRGKETNKETSIETNKEADKNKNKDKKIVQLDGKKLEVLLESKIPMTEISLGGKKQDLSFAGNTEFGVLPMGEGSRLKNRVEITLYCVKEGRDVPFGEPLSAAFQTQNVAPALWGLTTPSVRGAGLLPGAVTSAAIRLSQKRTDMLHSFDEKELKKAKISSRPVALATPYYRKRLENPNQNLAQMLEEWTQGTGKKEETLLNELKKRREESVTALHTLFPLWETSEFTDDKLYKRQETIFLVEPAVREFY